MPIARYYDESKNTEGAFFAGVPLDDITEERWDQLPDWLQASVDASPMYRKTSLPTASKPKAAPAPERGEEKD